MQFDPRLRLQRKAVAVADALLVGGVEMVSVQFDKAPWDLPETEAYCKTVPTANLQAVAVVLEPAAALQTPEFDYDLDQDAQALLHSLPAEVKTKVLAEFVPAAGTQNVSAKFQKYVRGTAWRMGFKEDKSGGGWKRREGWK